EWTATVAVRETACLAADDRRQVDAELAARLATSGPAEIGRAAWASASRLDPHAAVNRHAKAVSDRRVSVRPAPDAMTYLTALLPVKDGVAAYAALSAAAASARAAGDPRSRGQLMADELVSRLTGAAAAEAPVEVCVVITDEALLGGGEEPARVTTSGAPEANPADSLVPAGVARAIVGDAERAWVRRLYARPDDGGLVAMESRRRLFEGNLRRMLVLRDRVCRTAWCEAPVRHADHVVDHADGGPTSLDGGQGLCERCNQTKNLPGWRAEVVRAGPGHVVRTTTPTGRTYDSTAPPLLRTG
ncbi:MAG TPA: HNH endonuclease, partial [Angustibacter sp.]|nr:HNH endonuclease [Angustibacter sp.]